MAESTNVQGAADKIKGLLNPEQGQSEPKKKAEPSEQPQQQDTVQEEEQTVPELEQLQSINSDEPNLIN